MFESRTPKQRRDWIAEIDAIGKRVAKYFPRLESRERVVAYLRELVGDARRKNSWGLADRLGEKTPYATQNFIARSPWNPDDVRDELIRYVRDNLAHPDGVLTVGEAEFCKAGRSSAGVARQFCRATGRKENCQVGVFLSYSSLHGRVLIDRELYLPPEWIADSARRRQAEVPREAEFIEKVELARRMIARVLMHGLPVKSVAADATYGADYHFRIALEYHRLNYAVATPLSTVVAFGEHRASLQTLLTSLPRQVWRRREGDHGPLAEEWAYLTSPNADHEGSVRGWHFRRRATDGGGLSGFICGGSHDASPKQWGQLADEAATINGLFKLARESCGLDDYEVRKWAAWHRHITLSMFALAALGRLHRSQ